MSLNFMVCPHDTATNPEKWFQLAQYLSKHTSVSIEFNQSIDFAEYHQKLTDGGLIYANPQDSLRLIKEHGYSPIARGVNLYDEIVFIAGLQLDDPKIDGIHGNDVSSVNSMMVTRVGVKHCFDRQIIPSRIRSQATWMAVVKGVYREEIDYGMVYKDFYDGLNSLTKKGFVTLDQTVDGTIHHSLLVSDEFKEMGMELQACLLTMTEQSERSQDVLRELGVERFLAVHADEILQFEDLSTLGEELMI